MSKRFSVCGLGHALVDLLVRVEQSDFEGLGLEKAKTCLLDIESQNALLAKLACYLPEIVSGGSVANAVVALAQLGSKAAFIGALGQDKFADAFARQFSDLKIELVADRLPNQLTGTCLAIITPDAERTMCTCLGASAFITLNQQAKQVIADSEWLLLEGFTLTQDRAMERLIWPALEVAKSSDTKIAYSFSEAWVVEAFRENVAAIIKESSLIFCNQAEAMAFTGADSGAGAFAALKEGCGGVVLTAGEEGAFLSYAGQEVRVAACQANPIDLTGAGDMFAGCILHGIIEGLPHELNAHRACFMAKQVIEQVGARLKGDVALLFQSVQV